MNPNGSSPLSLRNERGDDPLFNIFPGSAPFSISDVGKSFLEGILSHLKGLLSLTIPTTNSFTRVGKGCWTGHSVGWQVEEKESPLRVCLDSRSRKATNVEFKLMDNSCNVYLALASVLWAGFEGIAQQMTLRPTMNDDENNEPLPSTLQESLDHLAQDQLLKELLGEELRTSYVAVKKAEIKHAQSSSLDDAILNELTK